MRKLRWILANGIFTACLYYGFVEDVGGFKNIALFYAWAAFVASLVCCMDEVGKALRKKGRSVPQWLDNTFDILVVTFLACFGAFWVATAYAIHIILVNGAYIEPKEAN